MSAPEGFQEIAVGSDRALARPEAVSWVREALERHGTLHAAASRHPDAGRMEGRGTVYAIPAAPDPVEDALGGDGGRWAVRHYRRGGAVARVLGDRYLRLGTPRPVAELEASEAVRARRIPTPRVVAAAVYPAGVFYRGDLVTAYVPDTMELAAVLFDPRRKGVAGSVDRKDALREAGALIRKMARAGVLHRDLNARNVLLEWSGHAPDAYVLDLDRCRIGDGPDPDAAEAMLSRLERSIRKLEKKAELEVPPGELEVLRKAART